MFSIAAINDTDAQGQWEPLAPTKEAQEFRLSQNYHEGLLKLQAKEYGKARKLFESVLKDPILASAQVDGNASDGHLSQLRYLALKNLASVFLQQGSDHYESALQCYLQAVEIDSKDSVLWNQLGTLSCSMGLLSISRWAFEQGLLCSPNNWNCMEKLLEVLIAIGDEVACLSVAELILRQWPSHSRALHVKKTIEDPEPIPFAPKGIDRLEPKHARLKFLDKRKSRDENLHENSGSKRAKQSVELRLDEASWGALVNGILAILLPLRECSTKVVPERGYRSGDIRLDIQLPFDADDASMLAEGEMDASCDNVSNGDSITDRSNTSKNKEADSLEEQPQERRSTRIERLRSRKPGKEESDYGDSKNLVKVAVQSLEPYIVGGTGTKELHNSACSSISCPDQTGSFKSERADVVRFVRETSKNYGAYHIGHLLLEYVASSDRFYQDAEFLELEKLTRQCGKDRSPECSLFLAELYYDSGSCIIEETEVSKCMSEASYHLCKVIESVALEYPHVSSAGSGNTPSLGNLQGTCDESHTNSMCLESAPGSLSVRNKTSFWVRFYWLSGQLSVFEGNKSKAYEEFCISLSHLIKQDNANNPPCSIQLPYCKVIKELTVDRFVYEINLLKLDSLLEKTISKMVEKEMHSECIDLLAPLIFSTKDVYLDVLPVCVGNQRSQECTSPELSALDILIKACSKSVPVDYEVYLNCHRRRLQILTVAAGMDTCFVSCRSCLEKPGFRALSISKTESKDWNLLIAEEIKAISHCVSEVKSYIDRSDESDFMMGLTETIGSIQSLLLKVMCNIESVCRSARSSGQVISDPADVKQLCFFIDAAVAFCKLQHLIPCISIKDQVELIVAVHDLLAERGLCCAGGDKAGEEGTFLKFAIKHLLALDIKLKSKTNSSNWGAAESEEQNYSNIQVMSSENASKSDMVKEKLDLNKADKTDSVSVEKSSPGLSSALDNDNAAGESEKQSNNDSESIINTGKRAFDQFSADGTDLTEDGIEELESKIDNALDQCFFCLYGLNLRSDSSYDDDLAVHKNTSRGDYQSKEQCADVFQYILPTAKASSRTGLLKLRRVLRAIRKHFPGPPDDVLAGNVIDKYLDDPNLCEDKLSEEGGSDGFLETIMKSMFPDGMSLRQYKASLNRSSEPYSEIYRNLYYFLAQSEETSATDKWPGFVLTKEGEEFVQQNANLYKYDLIYNPLRCEGWQQLANIYDEEVDLLLNDGSKHINVAAWRKNATLPERVDIRRRRSRRCLLMSLALAKTTSQQGEIHELLALVYYDSLQNVVPFYDQRSVVSSKDAAWAIFCENSMRHFKKAFANKQDWSHAFYMGKLFEKLKYPHDKSLSHYDKAISLNPSAVDPIYRMHASRLKKLWTCGKQDLEMLKIVSAYSFSDSTKDAVMDIFSKFDSELPSPQGDGSRLVDSEDVKKIKSLKMEEAWQLLYRDCLLALEVCVEGDLKHFHKARYMLAQGLYRRGETGDLERAKEELSFCFKSSRSCFTINMWEIDGIVKKGRRSAGNKRTLEVSLPESSRKFITCIRKYVLFYLKLLEEAGDICTLERAYVSLRADKRFSLCMEDLVPVAIARYIKALVSSLCQPSADRSTASSSYEHLLEKLFHLFMEQGTSWPEICSMPEIKTSETSESSLYSYLHEHIALLERNGKLEVLEVINEKMRKRFKNPKLSNSSSAKVCRHALTAWCRSLITGLASVTPLQPAVTSAALILNPLEGGSKNTPLIYVDLQTSPGGSESTQLLYIDLQTNDLWNSTFEETNLSKVLETKWSTILSNIKGVLLRKALDENLETVNSLLRSSYNFYRESSCVMLPSAINLYAVPSHMVNEACLHPRMEGMEILDLSIPRKLLLWSYALLHGQYANISAVVKYCEENAKSKLKRGAGTSSTPSNTTISAASPTPAVLGDGKDEAKNVSGIEADITPVPASTSNGEGTRCLNLQPTNGDGQRSLHNAPQLHHCNNAAEKSDLNKK